MSKCSSISLVETLPSGTDVLQVTIDDSITAYWFFKYADALKFVGQDVIVEYRQEVYKGELVQCISTFVNPSTIQTLDKKDNIKLYVEQEDNFANVSFSEIALGERRPGCIVYCVHNEYKTSNAAVWMECIIRDKSMHTAKLRLFDFERSDIDFSGQYIMTELVHNKYGFQTEIINPVQGECPPNPEIALAKQYIQNFFSTDVVTMDFIAKTNILQFMEEVIDYEKGYGLMRLAMELSIIDGLQNTSKDVDLQAVAIALLVRHSYLLKSSILSKQFNNLAVALRFNWANRDTVLQLLDCQDDRDPIPEHKVFTQTMSMVQTLLEIRKGETV